MSRKYLHNHLFIFLMKLSQQTFTCLNSTIETLEKGMKYVQS